MHADKSHPDLSFLMTVVKVNKLRFIWQPSFNLAPMACVCAARSLPARSTKFCTHNKQLFKLWSLAYQYPILKVGEYVYQVSNKRFDTSRHFPESALKCLDKDIHHIRLILSSTCFFLRMTQCKQDIYQPNDLVGT